MIDEIAALDEDAEMIAQLDVELIADGAARFFETEIQRQDDLLVLPSSVKKEGWQLCVHPRFFKTEASSENPWLDFLQRRYACQIHLPDDTRS